MSVVCSDNSPMPHVVDRARSASDNLAIPVKVQKKVSAQKFRQAVVVGVGVLRAPTITKTRQVTIAIRRRGFGAGKG